MITAITAMISVRIRPRRLFGLCAGGSSGVLDFALEVETDETGGGGGAYTVSACEEGVFE